MRTINTEIFIDASPELVWSVLVNFGAYRRWNPFIRSILVPRLDPGVPIQLSLYPPDSNAITLQAVIKRVKPFEELTWTGHFLMPGLFEREHSFHLEEKEGGVLFTQCERYRGVLLPLLWERLRIRTGKGFELMNQKIKERVEGKRIRKHFRFSPGAV